MTQYGPARRICFTGPGRKQLYLTFIPDLDMNSTNFKNRKHYLIEKKGKIISKYIFFLLIPGHNCINQTQGMLKLHIYNAEYLHVAPYHL